MKVPPLVHTALVFAMLVFATTPTSAASIDYAMLYAKISPSVVTVNTRRLTATQTGLSVAPGVGTGFLLQPTLVVTAAHVVDDADFVQVRFADDTRIDARVIALVPASDIALLRLRRSHPQPVLVELGDSDESAIGSPVFVIGAPYGIEQALSVGYLSGRMSRGELQDGSKIEFLQTDAAINPGNSGGPLFNENGQVIGIVSFILSKSGGFDGIGFASAINSAHHALMNSSAYKAGFEGIELSTRQSRALNIPAQGILVQRVVTDSLAHDLGLRAGFIPARIGNKEMLLGGDVILAVDCSRCMASEPHATNEDIVSQLINEKSVSVKIFRDGQTMTLNTKPSNVHVAFDRP